MNEFNQSDPSTAGPVFYKYGTGHSPEDLFLKSFLLSYGLCENYTIEVKSVFLVHDHGILILW